MCGIAGVVAQEPLPDLSEVVSRMVEAQVHRGPDDEGIVAFGAQPEVQAVRRADGHGFRVALGSRRLAIIDLSPSGHQPMASPDGNFWIVYNGEIYNFIELRQSLLGKGHRFRSNTDTEVVLHLYQEYGTNCLQFLQGMFAFAIWDKKNQRLFIARDRLGKKPLYYGWDGKNFLFASELKALLASNMIEKRLDASAILAYLSFGSVPAPLSIIEGIQSLEPGCFLTLQNKRLNTERYWHLSFDEDLTLKEEDIIDRLRVLLHAAVSVRLIADVPVGAFLSGGIDSSAIVAIIRQVTGGSIRTFSMAFQEENFNESRFANLIAKRFETEHTEYEVTPNEVLNELPAIIDAMDQPSIDGVNTYFVSKVARQSGTIVALSGLGGDELFGGYPSFQLVPGLYKAARAAHSIPGCCWFLEKTLSGIFKHGKVHKLKALFRHPPSPEMAYLVVRGLFLEDQLKALVNLDQVEHVIDTFTPLEYLKAVTSNHEQLGVFNLTSLLEMTVYMHNQLLRDTDVMSMVHSLEVRTPFLDHRLVEFLATVPAKYRFAGPPKTLLIRTLGTKLPQEIVNRPKGTFTFPFELWLKENWRPTMEEILALDGCEVLNKQAKDSLWQAFLRDRVHWSRIWAILVLQFWLDRHLRQNMAAPAGTGIQNSLS